ncbi:P-loop containing nucleoside triphosphate hydrolase protein [Backusella circina FSU 941]|nr:P-loop containing nucleoside triphosphate hydrolase protein [Backusella circina FSU 941]
MTNYGEQCQQLLVTLTQVTSLISTELLHNNDIDMQLTLEHLHYLKQKIADTNSKILVTGDLNSGKSTLVNALLKQKEELLPADQQPCTSVFCEVTPSTAVKEEMVHGIKDIKAYDQRNSDTFDVLERQDLYHIMTTEEDLGYRLIKVYTGKVISALTPQEDQDILNITLVDSPGLNTDSVLTTAVYARQDDVDVVMFVVNAENHFTLSGKEFLTNVANEKAQIFIVVNRFDNIRDKERCKRLILEQIQKLSPDTYENSDHLVHFVSAGQPENPDFIHLEASLRAFVLENRTHSKLGPIQRDLDRIVHDIQEVLVKEKNQAEIRWGQVQDEFQTVFLPSYHHLIETKEHAIKNIDLLKEEGIARIQKHCFKSLSDMYQGMDQYMEDVLYLGLFSMHQYAQEISDTLYQQIRSGLIKVETEADQAALDCMKEMSCFAQSQVDGYTIEEEEEDNNSNNRAISFDQEQVIPHIQIELQDIVQDIITCSNKSKIISGIVCISSGLGGILLMGIKALSPHISSRSSLASAILKKCCERRWTLGLSVLFGTTFLLSASHTISDIPQVIQTHIKTRIQHALPSSFEASQTKRIISRLDPLLEERQQRIQSRIQDLVNFKHEQHNQLRVKLQQAQFNLDHFSTLVDKMYLLKK